MLRPCIVLLCCGVAGAGDERYADDLRHLTTLLETHWSWLDMRRAEGVDLAALEREARALAAAEPGERGFLRALTRYVAGLRDGHAWVQVEGVDLVEPRRWPFSLVEVREGVMVDGIDPATFRSKALQRGDLVLEVDGTPIDDAIRAQEAFVFASTPAARRRKAIFRLTESATGAEIALRVRPMGGAEDVVVRLPCPARDAPVPRYAWRHFPEKLEDLDADTAYYCPGNFSPGDAGFAAADPATRERMLQPRYDALAKAFETIAARKRLVLDMRGNPGGTDLLGQALARHLVAPPVPYFSLASRKDGAWTRTSLIHADAGRGAPRFDGPVACLIDEETFSVADNFAACLRDTHPDVTFVGRPTGGGSGAPRTFTLPATKARVTFCTMRVWAPKGEIVEGNGVKPDVDVVPTRAQVLAGDDAVLEAALAALHR